MTIISSLLRPRYFSLSFLKRQIRKLGKRGDFCLFAKRKARMKGKKTFHSFTDSTHDIHKVNKITIVAERYLI